MTHKETLINLYQKTGKHSGYQLLPSALRGVIPADRLEVNSRYERERLAFLEKHLDFKQKTLLDVGGNTGFFSFEILEEGAGKVIYIEGNKAHADFVKSAARLVDKDITVVNEYLDFSKPIPGTPVDITLLLNVIHHLGEDFGDENLSLEKAKDRMAGCINYFRDKTDYLVLQMGFCWKGDTSKLLFEEGTKREMIEFIRNATSGKWDIKKIGIAEETDDGTIYKPLSEENIERDDSLGEFRNRPIFILKAL